MNAVAVKFLPFSLSLFLDTYIHIHIPRRASLSTLSLTLDSIETKLIAKHNIKINCSQLVISPFFDFVYISQTNNFISLRIMVKTRKIGSATQRNRYFVPDDRSRIATWRIRIWICTQWSLDPPYIRVLHLSSPFPQVQKRFRYNTSPSRLSFDLNNRFDNDRSLCLRCASFEKHKINIHIFAKRKTKIRNENGAMLRDEWSYSFWKCISLCGTFLIPFSFRSDTRNFLHVKLLSALRYYLYVDLWKFIHSLACLKHNNNLRV